MPGYPYLRDAYARMENLLGSGHIQLRDLLRFAWQPDGTKAYRQLSAENRTFREDRRFCYLTHRGPSKLYRFRYLAVD